MAIGINMSDDFSYGLAEYRKKEEEIIYDQSLTVKDFIRQEHKLTLTGPKGYLFEIVFEMTLAETGSRMPKLYSRILSVINNNEE